MRVIWGMREMTVTSTETKNQAGKTWLTPESESGVVWCSYNQQIRRKRRGFKTDINHKLLSKYRTMDVRLGNDGWECLEPVNRAHFRPISRCNNKAPGLHLNFCEIFSLFIANLSKLYYWELSAFWPPWDERIFAKLSSDWWAEVTGGGWGRQYREESATVSHIAKTQSSPVRDCQTVIVTSDWKHRGEQSIISSDCSVSV